MKCSNPECREEVPAHVRSCVVCGRDAGYPNVRAADAPTETAALDQRFEAARAASTKGGYYELFHQLQEAASRSEAVICRPLGKVLEMVSSDSVLYSSYYHQVDAVTRIPEDSKWDQARESVDSAVFPHYHREINYGALSLSGAGQTAYGPFSVVLRGTAISERASVFDEPLFPFFKNHGVVVGHSLPPGYRATWQNRGRLAAAKLGTRLTPMTSPSDFPALLLPPGGSTEGDCVEAHVYGPIHRRAIARVIGKASNRRADRILIASLKAKLEETGAKLEFLK